MNQSKADGFPLLDQNDPDLPLKLDEAGVLAAPGETLPDFLQRVGELFRRVEQFREEVSGEDGTVHLQQITGFKAGKIEPIDPSLFDAAAACTGPLFGFCADWVPSYFSSHGLGAFLGGCTVITEDGLPVFLSADAFNAAGSGLFTAAMNS